MRMPQKGSPAKRTGHTLRVAMQYSQKSQKNNGLFHPWLAEFRVQRGRPQRDVGAVTQGHRHLPGCAVDLDVAEELHAGRWRQVLLVRPRRLDELHLGSEGVVEFVRSERAGVQRAGDELPERIEFLELRLVGIV